MPARTKNYGRMAFEAIDDFERQSSPTALITRLASTLGQFGYTQFIVGSSRVIAGGKIEPCPLVLGWSQAWREHYVRRNYFRDDPVVAWARQSVNPFEWSQLRVDGEQGVRA